MLVGIVTTIRAAIAAIVKLEQGHEGEPRARGEAVAGALAVVKESGRGSVQKQCGGGGRASQKSAAAALVRGGDGGGARRLGCAVGRCSRAVVAS